VLVRPLPQGPRVHRAVGDKEEEEEEKEGEKDEKVTGGKKQGGALPGPRSPVGLRCTWTDPVPSEAANGAAPEDAPAGKVEPLGAGKWGSAGVLEGGHEGVPGLRRGMGFRQREGRGRR